MAGKAKKTVDSKRLSHLNGVYDVSFGSATEEGRAMRNFKKGGPKPSTVETDDERARAERYGLPF